MRVPLRVQFSPIISIIHIHTNWYHKLLVYLAWLNTKKGQLFRIGLFSQLEASVAKKPTLWLEIKLDTLR
jgi:hypothetical protein